MIRFFYLIENGVWCPVNVVDCILNFFKSDLIVYDLVVDHHFIFLSLGLRTLFAKLLIWARDAANRFLDLWRYKKLLPILNWTNLLLLRLNDKLLNVCHNILLLFYLRPVATCSGTFQNSYFHLYRCEILLRTKFCYLNMNLSFIAVSTTCLRGLCLGNVLIWLPIPYRCAPNWFFLCRILKRLPSKRIS